MTTELPFDTFSDDQLIGRVKHLVTTERQATTTLIRCLMEFDARRLYLREGCSSLFTYCTEVLHLSESAAYNRIEAARAARRFPPVIDALADGSLTLTAVRLLAPHLRVDNCDEVLAAARHQSKGDVERLVATLSPKPPAPSTIRKLPAPRRPEAHIDSVLTRSEATEVPIAGPPRSALEDELVPAARPNPSTCRHPPRVLITPSAPERYRVQFTVSRETREKLLRAQNLLRHTIPNGDPAEIFDRALTLLLQDVERRRCGASTSPRAARDRSDRSRHIPAAVKREVWRRDEGRCAFVGKNGRRKAREGQQGTAPHSPCRRA